MKKLVLVAIALLALQVTAQEKKRDHQRKSSGDKMEMRHEFTPEEKATLQTKKMTLHLDLTEAQQTQIKAIVLEQAILRKTKMEARQKKMEKDAEEKPSKEARLKMMNDKLDQQIEMKKKMKSILNADQFEKWKKMQGKRRSKKGGKPEMKKHNKRQ